MDRIEDCIHFLLGKAYQQASQTAKRRLAPHGVTPTQYALLKVLAERDGQTGGELGERLRLDSATITGLLDRLERAGLLARQPDPGDRRIHRIVATPAARALQAALDHEMDAANADFLAALSPDAAANVRTYLATLGAPGE